MLVSLLIFTLFLQCNSSDDCYRSGAALCGTGCSGTPSCGVGVKCGNIPDMCYCSCSGGLGCKTTALGYKWNHGAKLENGSYALNGTYGDGRQYVC